MIEITERPFKQITFHELPVLLLEETYSCIVVKTSNGNVAYDVQFKEDCDYSEEQRERITKTVLNNLKEGRATWR